eukprot:g1377.t1
MSSMADAANAEAVEARIAQLEAELEKLRLVRSPATKSERKEKTRLTKGQEHTMSTGGKIGGKFKLQANPKFLEDRMAVFERVKTSSAERFAALPRKDIKVTLRKGNAEPTVIDGKAWETTPYAIAKNLSNSLAKRICVALVKYTGERFTLENSNVVGTEEEDDFAEVLEEQKGELWDVSRPLEGDCDLTFFDFSDDEGKMVFWHSTAHVLGQALEQQFGAKLTIGPPTSNGCYYDSFVGDEVCTESTWYSRLDAASKKIVNEKQVFERVVATKEEALELFSYNPFKLEIIHTKVPDDALTTIYRNGSFIDLCMGPHIPHTGLIKAMKVHKHSATYFLGDENNDSLQRVYGVSFPDNKSMKAWEKDQELRKQRDHRRTGIKQELFFFHELSPGSGFFLPHGTRIYNTLVDFIKQEYWRRGYSEVVTPNIFSTDLWKISGHYAHYRDDMFLFKTADNDEFAMKPMNCPGHCLMFRHKVRSHRDLPLRLADFGVLHRNERSGALTGLTRVRRFQQDDAHIFCTPQQVKEEVIGALNFMKQVYGIFGMSFKLERSTRPKKAIGADTEEGLARWNNAEQALADALDEFAGQGNWRDNPGDGAFYGPKIDIKVFDCMGRKHQCATVQLDFVLPKRFNLLFLTGGETVKSTGEKPRPKVSDDGTEFVYENLPNGVAEAPPGYERPVMVHRAMLGSVERMMAILTEHFGGKWPFWLSPRQVQVVPVHPELYDFAKEVRSRLHDAGFYADVDLSGNTLKKMIRAAQVAQYNFTVVVGQDEKKNDTVSIRTRDSEAERRGVKIQDFIAELTAYKKEKKDPVIEVSGKESGGKDGKGGKGGKGGKAANDSNDENVFAKADIRVGQIVKVWPHPESEKLWCEEIDVGEESPRQIASGLRKYYTEEQMTNKRVLVVCNLKAAKLAGFSSNGMVLCAKSQDESVVEFVDPPEGAKPGERIAVEGCSGEPATPAKMKKKKIFQKIAVDLKTDGNCVACWKGKPLMTSAGPCTAPSLKDSIIN